MPIVYLPAIFFGLCTLYSYIKHGMNIQVLMYGLFFITGIASILLDHYDLYEYNCVKRDPGIIAPIMYCFLIWLCISPFSIVKEYDIRKIQVNYPKILDYVVYFYSAIFMIIVVVASTKINDIVNNAAFSELRQMQYHDENESFYNHLSGIPRYICALTTFFLAGSYINIPILFYNIYKRKKSLIFHIMTILASCCQLLTSLMQADRSQFVYWLLLFIFCLIFFWKILSKESKRKIYTLFIPVAFIIILYFLSVSISRWEQSLSGTEGGSIRYAGMNFFNFCNFFNACFNTPCSLTELFPLTYEILGLPNYFEWCDVVESYTGMYMSVFPTFVGLIASISTTWIAILYCILFHFIARALLYRRNNRVVTFQYFIKVWILAIVPLLGVFVFFYLAYGSSIALILWIIIGYKTKHKSLLDIFKF